MEHFTTRDSFVSTHIERRGDVVGAAATKRGHAQRSPWLPAIVLSHPLIVWSVAELAFHFHAGDAQCLNALAVDNYSYSGAEVDQGIHLACSFVVPVPWRVDSNRLATFLFRAMEAAAAYGEVQNFERVLRVQFLLRCVECSLKLWISFFDEKELWILIISVSWVKLWYGLLDQF